MNSFSNLNRRGFTLVELLVVIAIIGVLSSFGMISLQGAREKAYDATIKSDIANIRTYMFLCHDDKGGTYQGCTAPDRFKPPACSSDDNNAYDVSVNPSNNQSYIVYQNLCWESDEVFCADATGFSGKVAEPAPGQFSCLTSP